MSFLNRIFNVSNVQEQGEICIILHHTVQGLCYMKGGVADIKDDEPYHCASIIDSHHFTNSRKFMSQ